MLGVTSCIYLNQTAMQSYCKAKLINKGNKKNKNKNKIKTPNI